MAIDATGNGPPRETKVSRQRCPSVPPLCCGRIMSAPLTFDRLRELGITVAQRASGALWTDFNLHDPGVTLLELFSYALTELDYRVDFGLADLLADADDRLDLCRLGLHPPRAALEFRPVTATDLALALAQRCPDAQRVLVYPGGVVHGSDRRGLYDLYVVPAPGSEEVAQFALAQVHRAFHAIRNLCEDIGSITPARPLPCRLEAQIEVHRRQSPERTAALVYHHCTRLMIDGTLADAGGSVTRRDVFDRPESLFGSDGRIRGGAESIDLFFQAVSELDEVDDVTNLAFRNLETGKNIFAETPAEGEYRLPMVPRRAQDVGLVLRSRGLAVPFDLEGMHKELMRLRGEDRARRLMLFDPAEWDSPPPGRRRSFAHGRIGTALPAAFGVGDDLPPPGTDPAARAAALQLRGYLGLSDVVLADANADLALLPDLFSASAGPPRSYSFVPFDFGAAPFLAAIPGGSREDLAAELDSWRDRKGRALNHMLALYSEAFTQNSLQMHDLAHGVIERQDRMIEGRVRYLAEVAQLAADRAAGPDLTASESSDSRGVERRLAILLGFPERRQTGMAVALGRAGLAIEMTRQVSPRVARSELQPSDDPFDAFVPRLDQVALEPSGVLLAGTELLRDKWIEADVFRRAALIGAYSLAREERSSGEWTLFLDPVDPPADRAAGADVTESGLIRCGRFATRELGVLRANQICRYFRDLNTASEGLCIVEDLLLRGNTDVFAAMSLSVVMSGWSLRTASPDFRGLAEETVRLVCPAYLLHRVIWLTPADAARFDALHLDWRTEYQDAAGATNGRVAEPARQTPEALNKASAALRAFLSAQTTK